MATIDECIAGAPGGVRAKLEEVRAATLEACPGAECSISYRIPYYPYKGRLARFGLFKEHVGLFIRPPVLEEHARRIRGYKTTNDVCTTSGYSYILQGVNGAKDHPYYAEFIGEDPTCIGCQPVLTPFSSVTVTGKIYYNGGWHSIAPYRSSPWAQGLGAIGAYSDFLLQHSCNGLNVANIMDGLLVPSGTSYGQFTLTYSSSLCT